MQKTSNLGAFKLVAADVSLTEEEKRAFFFQAAKNFANFAKPHMQVAREAGGGIFRQLGHAAKNTNVFGGTAGTPGVISTFKSNYNMARDAGKGRIGSMLGANTATKKELQSFMPPPPKAPAPKPISTGNETYDNARALGRSHRQATRDAARGPAPIPAVQPTAGAPASAGYRTNAPPPPSPAPAAPAAPAQATPAAPAAPAPIPATGATAAAKPEKPSFADRIGWNDGTMGRKAMGAAGLALGGYGLYSGVNAGLNYLSQHGEQQPQYGSLNAMPASGVNQYGAPDRSIPFSPY